MKTNLGFVTLTIQNVPEGINILSFEIGPTGDVFLVSQIKVTN